MNAHLLSIGLAFAYVVLAVGLFACLVRVARGPSLADRVLAVDLMTVAGAGLMAIAAISFDASVFLDVALILIVTGFVGTAAFAQLIERQYRRAPEARAPAEAAADKERR